jgi:hypothetical protein
MCQHDHMGSLELVNEHVKSDRTEPQSGEWVRLVNAAAVLS